MKKNKTIAYMMAAMLLVGGTFAGTKALFTDKVDAAGEISISTGDVDVVAIDDEGWILNRNGKEYSDGTKGITDMKGKVGDIGKLSDAEFNASKGENAFANNLKPGDKLSKKVTIKNNGTLNSKISIDNTKKLEQQLNDLNGLIEVNVNNIKGGILKPGETTDIVLELIVNDVESTHNNTEDKYNHDMTEDMVLDLSGAWTIDAKQTTINDNIQ